MPPKSRRLRITGCFAATAALITGMALSTGAPSTSGAASPITAANPFRTGRTLIIPHGGGDGLYPENTMLAYDRTMAAGADVVDVDVRSTADGVLVAFHHHHEAVRVREGQEIAEFDAISLAISRILGREGRA